MTLLISLFAIKFWHNFVAKNQNINTKLSVFIFSMLNISFLYDRLIGKIASKTTPLRKNELYLFGINEKVWL